MKQLNKNMKNLTIINNPVIAQLGLNLHDINTKPFEYRENARKLGIHMGSEISNYNILPTKKLKVKTPLGTLSSTVVDDNKIGIVNVLRAGTSFALGMGEVFPNSTISFISAWREGVKGNISAKTEYMRGVQSLKGKYVIISDLALASGVSILACLDVLSKYIKPEKTIICSLHCAKEGIKNIYKSYPQIKIYSVFGPSEMNNHCYILNGPGDCGDRSFNT